MDAIRLYLKDIKKLPLLTAEEEIYLANRIKKGDKAARAKMIQSNLRLVINIAKKYSHLGVSMLDLIEEGNHGPDEGRREIQSEKRIQVLDIRGMVDTAVYFKGDSEPGQDGQDAGLYNRAPDAF